MSTLESDQLTQIISSKLHDKFDASEAGQSNTWHFHLWKPKIHSRWVGQKVRIVTSTSSQSQILFKPQTTLFKCTSSEKHPPTATGSA